MKKTIDFVGEVTIENNRFRIMKENKMEIHLNPQYEIHVLRYDGDYMQDMSNWMEFETFARHCITDGIFCYDAKLAFAGWVDMFYVLRELEHQPTTDIDKKLWAKTYELGDDIGGWHVFTDGKEHAIIWSSDGKCKEVVPLIGMEAEFLSDEFAVVKLDAVKKRTIPEIIPLKAKVEDCCIKIWWDTKWRPICYYQGKNKIPGAAKIKEVLRRFALNTGLPATQQYEIINWEI